MRTWNLFGHLLKLGNAIRIRINDFVESHGVVAADADWMFSTRFITETIGADITSFLIV